LASTTGGSRVLDTPGEEVIDNPSEKEGQEEEEMVNFEAKILHPTLLSMG